MTSVAIIDDDDGIRAALGTLMRSECHDVSMYISVEEFLASGTAAAKPSIIITDIRVARVEGMGLDRNTGSAGKQCARSSGSLAARMVALTWKLLARVRAVC